MANFPGAPVENLQLEVPNQHHLIAPVAVDVVNLKRRVTRQQAVLRIGPSRLPQHLAVEVNRCKAADLIERIAAYPRNILSNKHVGHAVAVQVTESCISTRSEFGC